jgi:tetratricopeptide (TPR) repeat protein
LCAAVPRVYLAAMTRPLLMLGFLVAVSAAVPAQAPEPPLADTRLTVHTLVREDIFAGFLQNDLTRLARAEKNLESLLATRAAERPSVLAWQGSAALTRAAVASEANNPNEFQRQYRRALELFAEAARLGPENVGVFAITGGTVASLADRLPAAERSAVWEQAYSAYQRLWAMQGAIIEKLPLHHKGEVLSGLAQSAQRTGRIEETNASLDRMLALLPGTPYARRAQQWKDDPSTRAQSRVTCQTCHAPGTLAARINEVSK